MLVINKERERERSPDPNTTNPAPPTNPEKPPLSRQQPPSPPLPRKESTSDPSVINVQAKQHHILPFLAEVVDGANAGVVRAEPAKLSRGGDGREDFVPELGLHELGLHALRLHEVGVSELGLYEIGLCEVVVVVVVVVFGLVERDEVVKVVKVGVRRMRMMRRSTRIVVGFG